MSPPDSHSSAGTATSPELVTPEQRRSIGTLTYTAAGLAGLFSWLLWGDFVALLKDRSVLTVVQLLLKRFEASDFVAGVLIGSVPPIISLLVVPIISYHSDRHRGRRGRRIPFLLAFTPIASLAMIGLAYSPLLGQWVHGLLGVRSPGLNPTILIFLGVFWATFEFASKVLGDLLFFALINDVVPKAYLGRFFGLFRAIGLLAGILFSYWLLGPSERHYAWLFVTFGLLYGVGFTLMCLKVKEGGYPPAPPPQPHSGLAGGFFSASRVYLRESFTKPYYLWVFAAYALGQLTFLPCYTYNVFFAKSLQLDMGTYGRIQAYSYMISFALAYPLGWLADRFHPLRINIVVMVLYAAVALWGGIYATNAHLFSCALLAYNVLSGTWYTGAASMTQRLFPGTKFAQYFSAMGIAGAVFQILLPAALGWFLDLTNHTYRYMYLASFGLALLALCASAVVHRRFMRLGGPAGYQAPE